MKYNEQGEPVGIPEPGFPVLYADGALSVFSTMPYVTKFYFYRLEPNFRAGQPAALSPVAQVVMNHRGFAAMALFFNRQLEIMVKNKIISKEEVDELRAEGEA